MTTKTVTQPMTSMPPSQPVPPPDSGWAHHHHQIAFELYQIRAKQQKPWSPKNFRKYLPNKKIIIIIKPKPKKTPKMKKKMKNPSKFQQNPYLGPPIPTFEKLTAQSYRFREVSLSSKIKMRNFRCGGRVKRWDFAELKETKLTELSNPLHSCAWEFFARDSQIFQSNPRVFSHFPFSIFFPIFFLFFC